MASAATLKITEELRKRSAAIVASCAWCFVVHKLNGVLAMSFHRRFIRDAQMLHPETPPHSHMVRRTTYPEPPAHQ
jgi:hypothetical protein